MFIATIDGKEVELKAEDLKPKEGYAIITPDKVPDGYFNQDTVNSMIKENVNTAKSKLKDNLKEDEAFHRSILSKHNIVLDDEGKPKGLKPTEDIDEVRKKVAQEVSSDYEGKLEKLEKELGTRNNAVKAASIMETVSGQWEDYWTKSFDGETPLIVEKYINRVDIDEEGKPFMLDKDGNKMFKGDGVVRPDSYFLNEELFGEQMKDKRQRGSGFGGGGQGKTPEGDVSKWNKAKKIDYIDKNGRDAYKKLVDQARNAKD